MNYIYVVSGFTQHRYDPDTNGSAWLYRALREKHVSADTEVWWCEWNNDPEGHARMVERYRQESEKVLVCGYSYGAGWWLRKFAETLHERSSDVTGAVVSDGVYRRDWPWRFMQWKAMTKQTLPLPGNIREIKHFIQHRNEPGGDRLEIGGRRVTPEKVLDVPHQKMDNADEYHEACLDMAARIFN